MVCPQASVSRLTYVSEQESSCPTTASDPGLEGHKVGSISVASSVRLMALKSMIVGVRLKFRPV